MKYLFLAVLCAHLPAMENRIARYRAFTSDSYAGQDEEYASLTGFNLDPNELGALVDHAEKRCITESDDAQIFEKKIAQVSLPGQSHNQMLLDAVKQQLHDRWQTHIASINSSIGANTSATFKKQLADQALEITNMIDAATNYGFDKVITTNQTIACCITTQNLTRVLNDNFKTYAKEYLQRQTPDQLTDLTTRFKIKYLVADYHARQAQKKDRIVSFLSKANIAALMAYTPAALTAIFEDNFAIAGAAVALQLAQASFSICLTPYVNCETTSYIHRETERWKNLMSELHNLCIDEQANREKETDENV